jgi:hypothetical protein
LDTKIRKIPVQERQFRVLMTTKGNGSTIFVLITKERRKCYFFIGCRTKISVIDSADTDNTPVFPLKGMIYFGGLVLGLFLLPSYLYGFIRH